MKIQTTILTVIAAVAFVLAGCSKTSSPAAGDTSAAAASVDTSKVEAVFASADAATKSAVDTAVTAIKNADYSGAVAQLQSLTAKFKLTDEQQAAVNDLIAKAQKAIADAASKTAGDATKAATDMTKSLGK
jgi:PBP1b-binding outer membrane lipoprotein LpoB